MALYLTCGLCGRKQADGLLSRSRWGHLDGTSHGALQACPTCKEEHADWQDVLVRTAGAGGAVAGPRRLDRLTVPGTHRPLVYVRGSTRTRWVSPTISSGHGVRSDTTWLTLPSSMRATARVPRAGDEQVVATCAGLVEDRLRGVAVDLFISLSTPFSRRDTRGRCHVLTRVGAGPGREVRRCWPGVTTDST